MTCGFVMAMVSLCEPHAVSGVVIGGGCPVRGFGLGHRLGLVWRNPDFSVLVESL